ncbi:hypothetical protein BBD26_0544 [Lactobacillus delbrueckii subsp. bulgaricus]|nr:hypothetical protein BBD26_0544 [Lactobacillus delbrueckii subsp. bulgaricus]
MMLLIYRESRIPQLISIKIGIFAKFFTKKAIQGNLIL